jgi:hypothetical protein
MAICMTACSTTPKVPERAVGEGVADVAAEPEVVEEVETAEYDDDDETEDDDDDEAEDDDDELKALVEEGVVLLLEVDEDEVEDGGLYVDEGVEDEEDEPELSKFQVPYITPVLVGAKNSNRLCEKSRPSSGQPGHSSTICAWVDLPL